MSRSSTLGFPRIGADRELKKATEKFWSGAITEAELIATGKQLRLAHWQLQLQAGVSIIPSNDFSFYDHILDSSVLVGCVPERYKGYELSDLEVRFAMGRGLQRPATENKKAVDVPACEMVKWFDSNYHYVRPEFSPSTVFSLGSVLKPVVEFLEAKAQGIATRPVLTGPVSLLYLGKSTKDSPAGWSQLELLPKLVAVYVELLHKLAEAGVTDVQIDEPILVFDLPASVTSLYRAAYTELAKVSAVKLMFTTYFGEIDHNKEVLKDLPVAGVHIDLVRARFQLDSILPYIRPTQVLSLGVVDGRNIWRTNFVPALEIVNTAVRALGGIDRVIVSTSSSLLHCPVTIENEVRSGEEHATVPATIREWFSFAKEKCSEVAILSKGVREGASSIQNELNINTRILGTRSESKVTHNPEVRARVDAVTPEMSKRKSVFEVRQKLQREALKLPKFPTTTIGSFPQTKDIRVTREKFAKKQITQAEYDTFIESQIKLMVDFQDEVGLDVYVHGEPERNDMVQYFLERMHGCTFTSQGWVQSYGSRYVRPPIIIGDVSRIGQMTVKEAKYAASLTKKPMKGMLTGPLTCLRWSFPRDDIPLSSQCRQLALAIRDEVTDLEKDAHLQVIQIDEPALREGLPLREKYQAEYLDWAVNSFRLSTSNVTDTCQIHSHFCYSDFNEIFLALQALDADVITIESSKSDLKLLEVLKTKNYTNEIGPGVYDIHSPRVPSQEEMYSRIQAMCQYIKSDMLWVNPDCGLKTRAWKETREAILNMVAAAKKARENKL